MPEKRLVFDDLDWSLESDGHPRVFVRNATLLDQGENPLIELSDFEATLSLAGLLMGEVRPKTLALNGLFLDVQRDEDGRIDVSLSGGALAVGLADQDARQAILQIFEQPAFSKLESVTIDGVTLQYDDLRAQRSWTIDGGRFRLSVLPDEIDLFADLALLTGGASVATVEANALVDRSSQAIQYGVSFSDVPSEDIASQQASLVWLSVLEAPISGSLRGGVDDNGNFLPVAASLKIAEGVLKPSEATRPIPFRSMDTYFSYNPANRQISIDQLAVDSDWIAGAAKGTADLEVGENGLPNDFKIDISAPRLNSTESGPWQRDIEFDQSRLSFDMRVDPFRLMLTDVSTGFEDVTIAASGSVTGGPDGWAVALAGSGSDITHSQLMTLWPTETAAKTRDWLVRNIQGADYSGLQLRLDADPSQQAQATVKAKVRNASLTYAPNMSPARQVSGDISLESSEFKAVVESGLIFPISGEGIDAAGTTFIIPDVFDRDGGAEVNIVGTGPVPAVLELIEQIPGLAGDDTDLRGLAEGRASLEGTLRFPIGRKPLAEEYIYSLVGEMTGMTSDKLVPGQNIKAALLDISASNDGIHVSGDAQIGGVDLAAVWSGSVSGNSTSMLTGDIELSQDFVTEFGLGLPEGTVSGRGLGTLFVDLPKGENPRFELISDLEGIGLDLGFVGWSKTSDTKGDLRASGSVGDSVEIDLLEISAPGFEAKGHVLMNEDGSLDAVEFEEMRLGSWLNGPVRIQGNGAGQASDIYIEGGIVDVQALTEATGGIGENSGKQVQGRVFANLEKLFVSDFLSLANFSGEFDLGRSMKGDFAGRLNGAVDIGGTIGADQQGRRVITATAEDAGAVMSALGLLDKASQGSIYVELTEKSEGYSGRFLAKEVRLLEMPLLADLLNAVSIVGLFDQLAFDGIGFAEVEGEFYFTESEFILTRASAIGASMGVSLDGTYDFEADQLDLQGVLSPVYLVNGIGEIFTRKGEGVFGFNFKVTGSSDNPKIDVNPLSALTPSIFRDLFRRPAPEAPE